MATRDGVIAWLGDDASGRAAFPDASHVDLGGAFVAPAFVDAHVHATSAGVQLAGLDLSGCASVTDCLTALMDWVKAHPDMPVWGHGWDESRWPERRPPTRDELDAVAPGTPVYLSRVDVHSALVTTALVERAPQARRREGWSATQPLSRAAHHAVRGAAQEMISASQRAEAQLAFLRDAAAHGVACVHECAGPDISGREDLGALLALAEADDLPQVVGYWGELGGRLGPAHGLGGDLFVDGALGSRTAAVGLPYADQPDSCGALYLDRAAIAGHVTTCTQAGVQAGFHVIGDAGVAEVVAGFALAERAVGANALAAARHRLEHLEMVTAEQAAQLAEWGVVASVQPLFDAEWGGREGMYAQRLGPDRGSSLNPFATLEAAGMVLAFGSDTPVTAHDPWRAVQAAVHHKTPGQGVSPAAAFAAHTQGGWHAAGMTGGTLAVGAPATYAVWETGDLVDGLPRLDPGAELPTCLRTVHNGHTLHQRALE
ncbi:amidohydrolase [Labedaea rhizosphaerae]|uniref:Amidohydrolase 3 domain-containing protein n=1 Tax=Labedaea rhizosphaerae TaxID=598644 RepID=A0A4R6RZY5_LABRH|nr:amidohydrolase family protein [Labedaea rhizosphaerae]TDP92217.1 hypothetical protein EV186_108430 [Labedaea rhizosphaerae]